MDNFCIDRFVWSLTLGSSRKSRTSRLSEVKEKTVATLLKDLSLNLVDKILQINFTLI